MHVLLADPPWIKNSDLRSYPNVGILYLAAALRDRGHRVTYLPGLRDKPWHLQQIRALRPDLIGISFASPLRAWSYHVIQEIRAVAPETPIVCGGPHPTGEPEEVLRETEADFCIVGEGEQGICELVDALTDGRPLEHVAGLVFRGKNGAQRTLPRPVVQDLDDLAMPAWDLVDDYLHEFTGNTRSSAKPTTCVVVTRGCPWNCVFCSQPVWKAQKPYIRAHSPERVADELELLARQGIRDVYVRADEFNFTKDWAMAACEAIAARDLRGMRLQCNVIAKKGNIDSELAAALARAGFWLVHIGVESANQHVLDGIQKPVTVAGIEDACRWLSEAGIRVFGFLMMYQAWKENGELRHETTEDVERTLAWVKRMVRRGHLHYMSWSFATPFTGSQLDELADEFRIRRALGPSREFEGIWEARMQLPGVTEREMRRMRRKGILLQGYLAWKSGGLLRPRNYRKILSKVRYLLTGRGVPGLRCWFCSPSGSEHSMEAPRSERPRWFARLPRTAMFTWSVSRRTRSRLVRAVLSGAVHPSRSSGSQRRFGSAAVRPHCCRPGCGA